MCYKVHPCSYHDYIAHSNLLTLTHTDLHLLKLTCAHSNSLNLTHSHSSSHSLSHSNPLPLKFTHTHTQAHTNLLTLIQAECIQSLAYM